MSDYPHLPLRHNSQTSFSDTNNHHLDGSLVHLAGGDGHPEESSFLRSETMALVQLYIPTELSHSTVSELGELGLVEFRDLNEEQSLFQRTYISELKRLEEMHRRIRYLKSQCSANGVPVKQYNQSPADLNSCKVRSMQEMEELNVHLQELEQRLLQMTGSYGTLKKRYAELNEMRVVLRECAFFFDEASGTGSPRASSIYGGDNVDDTMISVTSEVPLVRGDDDRSLQRFSTRDSTTFQLSFVAGIISRSRMITLERILWRALRGNLLMRFSEVEDHLDDVDAVSFMDISSRPSQQQSAADAEQTSKAVFIVFAHGKEVLAKIRKISEGMGATIYPLDSSPVRRSEDMLEVTSRIEDLNNVLFNTKTTLRSELSRIAHQVDQWDIMVRKEKGVFHTLNLFNFDSTRKCLIGEGWCPVNSISAVQYALHAVSERAGAIVPPIINELKTSLTPPTFHKTNKYTNAFQVIVDAYGVAKYKEVNPGLFTIITFPFLFGVMFGDLGHGAVMAAAGLYMILREKQLDKPGKGEMFATFFGGRYIIFLMGIFSMFAGLIYNDIFSLPMALFQSSWTWDEAKNQMVKTGRTYPFGIDYQWRDAQNSMLFLNSYKMKMSIVIGVIHMTFGICLSYVNGKYFKKALNIYCEFVPQIIFLNCMFGYLSILIIYKWLHASWWPQPEGPPALLQTLIFMFLSPGKVLPKDQIYPGQAFVQSVLVLVALICIPWMLCVKPYFMYKENQRKLEANYLNVGNNSPGGMSYNSDVSAAHNAEMHGEKFELGQVMIHQIIHTIEFCLGAISNTASYLRLWALSLAHAQLSEVLWDLVMKSALNSASPLMIVIIFYFWFGSSVAILVVMEGLSAFLHALRLHWVEFNNKFYEGSGVAFQPFSFNTILDDTAST